MSKYIEVYEVGNKLRRRLDELKTIIPPSHYNDVVRKASLIIRFLQEQPAKDVVERKRGEWIQHGEEPAYCECSACGKWYVDKWLTYKNYCSYCGAEMKEVEE